MLKSRIYGYLFSNKTHNLYHLTRRDDGKTDARIVLMKTWAHHTAVSPFAHDEERFLAFYLVTSARFCIFGAEKTDLRNQEDPYHDTL